MEKIEYNLIRSVAWKYAKKSSFEFEDLYAEASLAYCKAMRTYNSDKGCSRLTYYKNSMKYAILNYMRKENKNLSSDVSVVILDDSFRHDIIVGINLQSFSEDATFIFNVIKEDFSDAMDKGGLAARYIRGRIRKQLNSMEWNRSRIKNAFEELHTAMR